MKSISASQAKRNFGQLLADATKEPVRIVRYGEAVAAIVPAAWLEQNTPRAAPRTMARAAQKELDRAREDKHLRIALALLTATPKVRQEMLDLAKQMVERWEANQLCSRDYIDGWKAWLTLPLEELVCVMTSTSDPWARPMRQNSPFVLANDRHI